MAKKLYSINEINSARKLFKLPTFASSREINDIYREMAKKYHPDVCGRKKGYCERQMRKINRAYEILKNYIANYRYSFNESAVIRYNPAAKSEFGFSSNWSGMKKKK